MFSNKHVQCPRVVAVAYYNYIQMNKHANMRGVITATPQNYVL